MPMFDGDAIFFRALERDAYQKLVHGQDCGWSKFVTGRVEAVDVEGNHITMLQEPNVEVIGRVLRAELDRVSRDRAPTTARNT
jgi:thioesterase domain-containing protein